MKLVSLNVGKPQEFNWMGKIVRTSIFKHPVNDSRKVSFLNIEGDEQSDLNVHGGINKAVYAYDVSHYHHWKAIQQRDDWQHGMFGENLTTSGLLDHDVRIGDIYEIGTAKFQVIQPRFPCFKLNIRFGLPNMIERFMEEKRNGIYFKVFEEGTIQVNDEIRLNERSPINVTVSNYVDCYYSKGSDKSILKKLLSVPFLPERHRTIFESYL
ncbi:MAG TPA: MOSC domain-containing protein [Flavisolibacter sp.]|jgi:MOSC domain-containing protein YiiM|nr:MOSC domain-containing protein [Flavisolibacter sp.]